MNLAVLAPYWLAAILFILLLAAAAEDLWRLRISNWTCIAILIAALIAVMVVGPTWRLWENAAIFAAVLGLGTLLFSAGMLGGGDVKLLAVSGLWFDFAGALRMILAVAIAGGLLALILIGLRRIGWSEPTLARLKALNRRGGIPYGVAIAAGTAMTAVLAREAARII